MLQCQLLLSVIPTRRGRRRLQVTVLEKGLEGLHVESVHSAHEIEVLVQTAALEHLVQKPERRLLALLEVVQRGTLRNAVAVAKGFGALVHQQFSSELAVISRLSFGSDRADPTLPERHESVVV